MLMIATQFYGTYAMPSGTSFPNFLLQLMHQCYGFTDHNMLLAFVE